MPGADTIRVAAGTYMACKNGQGSTFYYQPFRWSFGVATVIGSQAEDAQSYCNLPCSAGISVTQANQQGNSRNVM